MKKLFLTLLLSVFLVSNAWAVSATFLDLISSGGVTCDDCSGSLKFAWHMEDNDDTPDVTLGTPCGCSDGDTIGTKNGTPVFSTTQKSDGSRSLHIDALDDRYEFTLSSFDIFDLRDIKITFDVYIISFPSGTNKFDLFSMTDGGSDYFTMRLKGTTIQISAESGGVAEYIDVSGVSTGSWVSCEYQAKDGVVGNDHYLNCTGVAAVEEDDDWVTYTGNGSGVFRVGENSGNEAEEYYLDNIKIDISDRY